MIIIIISLFLEVVGIILALILAVRKYPAYKPDDVEMANRMPPLAVAALATHDAELIVRKTPRTLRGINDALLVISFLLFILMSVKNGFYPDKLTPKIKP